MLQMFGSLQERRSRRVPSVRVHSPELARLALFALEVFVRARGEERVRDDDGRLAVAEVARAAVRLHPLDVGRVATFLFDI